MSRAGTLNSSYGDRIVFDGRVLLITIGVNRYANSQFNLQYAETDAKTVAEALGTMQTATGSYDHAEALSLINNKRPRSG